MVCVSFECLHSLLRSISSLILFLFSIFLRHIDKRYHLLHVKEFNRRLYPKKKINTRYFFLRKINTRYLS
ncbi:hypothetical protein MtrunA17_Chr5g0401411 [Medicago truncatula]|uniref:Transmembrane protein n=1 Tax=Medicago truncatula TaxID=3880 RepID=A0A396HKW8_MEDTR|nr:hypothetical protein MtrunA17_Chr5g0401411 [Medicago truncatula]